MFSGIIETLGTVESIKKKKNQTTFSVKATKIFKGAKVGDSIAVNGVCLTVSSKAGRKLHFDMMKETLKSTTFSRMIKGSRVNLERALKVGKRFDGHFVTGHIDGVGTIKKKVTLRNYVEYQISVSSKLTKYIVEKGSVCVDGISLTVGDVGKTYFSVYLIPHTLKVTTIGSKESKDTVNIETDILAKYLFKYRRK